MPDKRQSGAKELPSPRRLYEIELIAGLEPFVEGELDAALGRRAYDVMGYASAGRLSLRTSAPPARLLALRTVAAVHAVDIFDVPRPKALLGHEHFGRFMATVSDALRLHPAGAFQTFRVSAAGRDSSTMLRLRGAVGAATRLEEVDDGGHLIVSIRRAQGGGGWEMLVRISPMPLSARRWRVCNRADAANAAIARAMAGWAGAAHGERFLNLCSGSGTILIERALMGGAASVVGVEIDAAALACAEANMRAAGVRGGVHLIRGDARNAPLRSASFDAAAADLPFGMVANTAEELDALYDATLGEAARLVVSGGAFVALTARRRLFEAALSRHARRWSRAAEARLRVSRRGGHIAPSLYLLRRL